MKDRAEGFIEGLGVAVLLLSKYKNPKRVARELQLIATEIQLAAARERLDFLEIETHQARKTLLSLE
jgi:hypothetical protein